MSIFDDSGKIELKSKLEIIEEWIICNDLDGSLLEFLDIERIQEYEGEEMAAVAQKMKKDLENDGQLVAPF